METRDFSELLKGCRPVKDSDGNIVVQSILNMQVVCLTTDKEYSMDERFGNPLTALRSSNSGYGEMTFVNSDNKEVIIPTQMAVMTKQHAQNHGMTKAGYVSPRSTARYTDAGCVEGSQPGYFSNTQEFRLIPLSMREMVFDAMENGEGYSRIYPAIERLGRDTQSNTSNYLDRYFNKYDKKLEQFIAHFERPKNLIGIIVLVDGEILAIDKFPSFTYAEQVWEMMIRDCYGSVAIMANINNKNTMNEFSKTYEEIKAISRSSVVELLEKVMKETKERMTKDVADKIHELMEVSFEATRDTNGQPQSTTSPKSYMLKGNGYVGQVIEESEFNHLVSIVKRESFNPDAFRESNELRRKARRQQRFSL